jgi:outer membrane protein OmpA-like peptidoglycan-associated protein
MTQLAIRALLALSAVVLTAAAQADVAISISQSSGAGAAYSGPAHGYGYGARYYGAAPPYFADECCDPAAVPLGDMMFFAFEDAAPDPEPVPVEAPPPAKIPEPVFVFDKTDLERPWTDGIESVRRYVEKDAEGTVVIVGHTDECKDDEYNIGLGERRATAIRDMLVTAGIDTKRLAISSRGESQPNVETGDEFPACQKLINRRVTIELPDGTVLSTMPAEVTKDLK